METLSREVAQDIIDCANVCDTYLKRSTLSKVLMGGALEVRLTIWIDKFIRRKQEFQFFLTLFTATETRENRGTVDDIDKKSVTLRSTTAALMMLTVFYN